MESPRKLRRRIATGKDARGRRFFLPVQPRVVEGSIALLVRAGTRIHVPVRPGETRISARFEVPGLLVDGPSSAGVRVRIELATSSGEIRTLYEPELDVAPEPDRGAHTVELELPLHGEAEVLPCTEAVQPERADKGWLHWTDFTVR